MKILAVSQFYTPDITAAAFRISESVGYLREFGHDVEVVTSFPHKSAASKEVGPSSNGVHRVRLPDTENKGFLGYIYLYLSFCFKSILKGYSAGRQQKPDVVWASSPPIFVGLSGWVLAQLLGAAFVLDIRDIWPDSAVAAGQISDSGFAYRGGRWMEKFLYRQADAITCVATPMKEYIASHTDKPVEVIYNGVKVDGHEPPSNKAAEDVLEMHQSIAGSHKLLYAGNFGHVQQLEVALSALHQLKEERLNHPWELFLLGGGVKKEFLERKVDSLGLRDRVHFLEPVPKKKVGTYLGSADALFIHLQNSEVLKLTIPSKVFDYMLAERAIVAGIEGEGREILASVEGNKLFDPGDIEGLKNALLDLDRQISEKAEITENSLLVRRHYSRQSQSQKLQYILEGLIY